jgi:hypothetical protein
MFFFLDQENNDDDKHSLLDLFNEFGPPQSIGSAKDGSNDAANTHLKEEDKDETLQVNSEGLHSIQEKRQRGKIRSKKSRDRKKRYVEELETRVKELEKENIRLHNIIASTK